MKKGSKMTQEQKLHISQAKKGTKSPFKGMLKSGIGEKFCESCRNLYKCDTRIGDVRWRKQRFCTKSCALKDNKRTLGMFLGEANPSWKGGITPINALIRSSTQMNDWRKLVFKRDNYTCVWCGIRGGRIEADHIKPFAIFPELRFEITNGRTLCSSCHKKTDTYAGRGYRKIHGRGATTGS